MTIFTCGHRPTVTPGELFGNGLGGPPDWVVLQEGGLGRHEGTTVTVSTRLPILEGCVDKDLSGMENGQSGQHPDGYGGPGKSESP